MPHSLIAQRYAKAVFELALEKNEVDEVMADMELIRSVYNANREFMQLLKSPVIRAEKKMKVMEALFKDKINEISMRFLIIITRKKREKFIGDIAIEFISIYKKYKNIFTVHLETATAISDDLRKKVIALMEDQTKGSIELKEEVTKELVGGFVISYDDYKYDVSIAYQLRKLKKAAFDVNLYVSKI